MTFENPVVQNIWNRLHNKNQNFICATVGRVGSGKSYIDLSFAELLDPDFTLENVVFNAKDFLSLINSDRLKRGSAMLWDEMSVDMYSRDFQTIQNKLINHVITTFRTKNIALFFTAPSLKFVDVGVQRLCHAVIETININTTMQENIFKFKWVVVNPIQGDPIYPYPRVIVNGEKVKIKEMRFSKSKFADDYEKRRKEFADTLAKSTERDFDIEHKKEEHKKLMDVDIMTDIKKGIATLDVYSLQLKYSIGKDRAYRIINNFEKYKDTI